jgi:hypothetical protein
MTSWLAAKVLFLDSPLAVQLPITPVVTAAWSNDGETHSKVRYVCVNAQGAVVLQDDIILLDDLQFEGWAPALGHAKRTIEAQP